MGATPANSGNRKTNRTGAVVSRRLRRDGFNISPSANRHVRPGMYVRAAGDVVSILVDLVDAHQDHEAAHELASHIATWPEVGVVEVRDEHSMTHLYFTYRSGT
jgi:hypothetical protein